MAVRLVLSIAGIFAERGIYRVGSPLATLFCYASAISGAVLRTTNLEVLKSV